MANSEIIGAGQDTARRAPKKYHLTYDGVMPFGKYKGKLVKNIMSDHPSYLQWVMYKGIASFGHVVKEAIENYSPYSDSHADDYERYAEWL